jgi:hypothetical protein
MLFAKTEEKKETNWTSMAATPWKVPNTDDDKVRFEFWDDDDELRYRLHCLDVETEENMDELVAMQPYPLTALEWAAFERMEKYVTWLLHGHSRGIDDYRYTNLENTIRCAMAPFLATEDILYKQYKPSPTFGPHAYQYCKLFFTKGVLIVRLIVSWHGGKKKGKKLHSKLRVVPIDYVPRIISHGYYEYENGERVGGRLYYDFDSVHYEYEDGSDMTKLDDIYLGREAKQRTPRRKTKKKGLKEELQRQRLNPTITEEIIDLAGDYMAGTSQTPVGTAEPPWKHSNHNIGHGPDNTGGNDCPPQRRTGNPSGALSVARARIEFTEKYSRTVGQSATKQTKMTMREPPDTPPEDQAEVQTTIKQFRKERIPPKCQGPG